MRAPTTAVIGAGISGLTAGKMLTDYGIDFTTFEASDRIGGNWAFGNPNGHSSAYRSLHIDTSKHRLSFKDFPMPDDYPDFPHHTQIKAYLDDYADAFGLRENIEFGNGVVHAKRLPDGGWEILDQAGDTRRFAVRAPSAPEDGVVDVGALAVARARPAGRLDLDGVNSTHRVGFDEPNGQYYEGVFAAVTAGRQGDEARVHALVRFVASLYRPNAGPHGDVPPRLVIERGSGFSSDLSRALATLARAGGYDARVIDMLTPGAERHPLMIAEVRYGGSWHAYDPSFGVAFMTPDGRVPSYEEIRLSPALVERALDPAAVRYADRPVPAWIAGALLSGIHHYYWLEKPGPVV